MHLYDGETNAGETNKIEMLTRIMAIIQSNFFHNFFA